MKKSLLQSISILFLLTTFWIKPLPTFACTQADVDAGICDSVDEDKDTSPPGDTDGDGIINDYDLCPTLTGPMDTEGCPDADSDGMSDSTDPCPGDESNTCEAADKPTSATTTSTSATPVATTTSTSAATATQLDNPYGIAAKNVVTEPTVIIAVILQYLLGIVGAATLLIFIWAGLKLIFSEGNEEKITKSRSTLVWATIGLAIILSSYSILSFTFDVIQSAAGSK